jgi:hypothetical protein
MSNNIILTDPAPGSAVRITQLYELLELYSSGEPPAHTLFVLGRAPLSVLDHGVGEQMLLIDPPGDARQRFRLDANVAALFTTSVIDTAPRGGCPLGAPQVQTAPGGVAHIRVGEHFIDIYSQQQSNVVCFPALGIICSGSFGSDAHLPMLAPGSDGSEELATLRLLARLVKQSRFQLLIPQLGSLSNDPTEVLMRLAGDVAYLHGLQRVVAEMVKRRDDLHEALEVVESLLPANRRSPLARTNHQHNLQALAEAATAVC